jgi:hypothetical protein
VPVLECLLHPRHKQRRLFSKIQKKRKKKKEVGFEVDAVKLVWELGSCGILPRKRKKIKYWILDIGYRI